MAAPTTPPETANNHKYIFARVMDIVTLVVCVVLIILCASSVPPANPGVNPFNYAAIYILLMVVMIVVRCVIGLLSYEGDYDMIDFMLLSTIIIGPALVAGAYTLSRDEKLRDVLTAIGTSILGVGTGAIANNSKASLPKRKKSS